MGLSNPTVVFAGDRNIGVRVLEYLTEQNVELACLIIPDKQEASHGDELISIANHLEEDRVLRGNEFKQDSGIDLLSKVEPDYILSVHFQYIYPPEVLKIPKHGVVNSHPAYLPYNRGWHTPSWAIFDETPYGATLHFMDDELDSGGIISRKSVDVKPDDTADSLYGKALEVEYELFRETWPMLAEFDYETEPQPEEEATSHKKEDLKGIQEIKLDELVKAELLIRKLRALTTNKVEEAAFYKVGGEKYHIQVDIVKESDIDGN